MVSGRTRPRSLIAETTAMEAEGQLFCLGRMAKEKPLILVLSIRLAPTYLSKQEARVITQKSQRINQVNTLALAKLLIQLAQKIKATAPFTAHGLLSQ